MAIPNTLADAKITLISIKQFLQTISILQRELKEAGVEIKISHDDPGEIYISDVRINPYSALLK